MHRSSGGVRDNPRANCASNRVRPSPRRYCPRRIAGSRRHARGFRTEPHVFAGHFDRTWRRLPGSLHAACRPRSATQGGRTDDQLRPRRCRGLGTALTSSDWFARRVGSGDRLTGVKKSARSHQIGRIWMRPHDGASNRYEVGPCTTTLYGRIAHPERLRCAAGETLVCDGRFRARAAEHPPRSRTQAALRRTSTAWAVIRTQDGNAHIASPRSSTSACRRVPQRRQCRAYLPAYHADVAGRRRCTSARDGGRPITCLDSPFDVRRPIVHEASPPR